MTEQAEPRNAGENINAIDVRDTTFDTPLPVYYGRTTEQPAEQDAQLALPSLQELVLSWERCGGIVHPTLRAALAAPLVPEVSPSAEALREMERRKDAAYLERNQVVAALAKCFPSGTARTAIEGWSEDWHGCVYIDLPTGQASWHFHDSQAYLFAGLPPYTGQWDGHDTPEKYRRLAALAAQPAAGKFNHG